MKKIMTLVALGLAILGLNISMTINANAVVSNPDGICPKNGCGHWNNVKLHSAGTIMESKIAGPSNDMFMYNIRDYFAESNDFGPLTVEVYNHWDKVSFDFSMLQSYKKVYDLGLESKGLELMYPSGNKEHMVLVDDEMHATLVGIIDYHYNKTADSSFKSFLSDAKNKINLIKGKTLPEIRIDFYGCAMPNAC